MGCSTVFTSVLFPNTHKYEEPDGKRHEDRRPKPSEQTAVVIVCFLAD
jgi:hypothetical protein